MAKILCPFCDSPYQTWIEALHVPVTPETKLKKGEIRQYRFAIVKYRCKACGKTHTAESDG